jgi:ABC-2 type transport system permease protein
MYSVYRVFKKELLQLRRDPRIFPMLFVAPVIQLLFMGYAATLDIKHIPIIVWDQDRTPHSRELIRRVTSSLYFDQAATVDSYLDIEREMQKDNAMLALVIPPDFGYNLGASRTATIQAVLDGSDSNQALIAQNYLSIIAQMQSAKILTQNLQSLGPALAQANPAVTAGIESMQTEGGLPVSAEPRVWYNPELRSANFMVPGVVVMVLLVITMMLTALAVVREKETGTMEQVIVTPIQPWQFILGKLLPFVIIGFIEVTIVVMVAVLWFEVPFQGSVIALYAYAALFLLTTLGFGLFVSTISNNQQQAMMTAFFIMFVMIQLSGFMFPIENMPRPVQWLTYLIPMRYFLVIVRTVFLKGSGLLVLWTQALGLLVLGVAVISLSVRRFQKTLD